MEKNTAKIEDYKITMTLCEGDFEQSMKRKPKDQEEFNTWAELAEKGLLNGHIDWNVIYECTSDAMPCDDEDEEGRAETEVEVGTEAD